MDHAPPGNRELIADEGGRTLARIEAHIYSEVLAMDTTVHVILPQERQPYIEDRPLKVLWLLHGGSGDETAWFRMSAAERYAVDYGISMIAPNGMNSCFTDMAHGERFFTYLTEELPSVLSRLFPRLSTERSDNFIAGYSNGGYGCLKAGLGCPERYAAIGAFSAGNKADVPFANDGSPKAHLRMLAFGDGDLKNTENDLQYLAIQALRRHAPLPAIYHACGQMDPWRDLNEILQRFFSGLEGNPFRYTYRQADGFGHTWEFWEKELLSFLDWLGLTKTPGKYLAL